MEFEALCPICERKLKFIAPDDFFGCRDYLVSPECLYNKCITRERAVALVLFSLFPKEDLKNKII